MESVRCRWISELLFMKQGVPLLIVGGSGCGKSCTIHKSLDGLDKNSFQYVQISLSAMSTGNEVQEQIDARLEKRRKAHYGPPIGQKCIVFVDDMNMPKKQLYGAQPPLELLRQLLDYATYYNRKDLHLMHIEDLILIASYTLHRQPSISNRLLRHFFILAYPDLLNSTLNHIFTSLITLLLHHPSNTLLSLVQPTIAIYHLLKLKLLPTPLKPHYSFTLRQLHTLIQSICLFTNTTMTDHLTTQLWYHELTRVFCDRLINKQDKQTFISIVAAIKPLPQLLLFANFMNPNNTNYLPIDMPQLQLRLQELQDQYNQSNPKQPLNLVLFNQAAEQIIIISRILALPQANALLIGIGASGRQSLTRIANYIQGHQFYTIQLSKHYSIRNWHEDLRKLLMKIAFQSQSTTFLFSDTQIIHETFIENINQLLNSADITSLYPESDLQLILQECKSDCTKLQITPSKQNIYRQYLNRIKTNLHIVLCMSPIHPLFSTRLRMFPSLIAATTISYFQPWPAEALTAVAQAFLDQHAQTLQIEQYSDELLKIFSLIHQSAEKATIQFKEVENRCNHVTPLSYLNLLSQYRKTVQQKRDQLVGMIDRFQNGLNKLLSANTAVDEMSVQLEMMHPDLEQASIETQVMMEKLAMDKIQADEVQKQVAHDESIAGIQQAQATELANQARQAVEQANISLEATLQEVSKLKKDHIVEIKSLGAPPKAVRVILGGVVILNQETIRKNGGEIILKNVESGGGIKKEEDYFETAKKYLLNDSKELLDLLRFYDKDSIPNYIIQRLEQKVMIDGDFSLERAKQCSYAVKFLFSWVKGMYDYNKVYLETKPLRDKLETTKRDLDEKTVYLNQKKKELDIVNAKIKELETIYNEKVQLREDLVNKIQDCQVKISRASKLTVGLSDEQKRWAQEVSILKAKAILIAGDCISCSGMMVYGGPFSQVYREQFYQEWGEQIRQSGIPMSKNSTMRSLLGVALEIQNWQLKGLAKDDVSVENAILMNRSDGTPLLLDPQMQGVRFVKQIGQDHVEGLDVLRSNENGIIRVIEMGVQLGRWILVENVGEQLDPYFDQILMPQFVSNGVGMVLGEKIVEYNPSFRLFLATKLSNPNYSAETFVKTLVINFSITRDGLEEQMLSRLVQLENPQLEQRKVEIISRNAEDQRVLYQIEDSILNSLSASSNSISDLLRDETLINELQNSKKLFHEINKRIEDSKQMGYQIDMTREQYRQVARICGLSYFTILSLYQVEYMYQWSLEWFGALVDEASEKAEQSNDVRIRSTTIQNQILQLVYDRVCNSLFERHKLMFSLLLTTNIHQVDPIEWKYFLHGYTSTIEIPVNPCPWISDHSWPSIYTQLYGLSILIPSFHNLINIFQEFPADFRSLYLQSDNNQLTLPEPFHTRTNLFQKILLLKSLRPDLLISALHLYIQQTLSPYFLNPKPLDLQLAYSQSNNVTPLLFILSPASDPISSLLNYHNQSHRNQKFESISLGQGQGAKADRIIKASIIAGNWVLLQNCHLALTWMPELSKIIDDLNSTTVHKDFRIWLTSMPSKSFPSNILQNGIKLTIEPPRGIRNNLLQSYLQINSTDFDQDHHNHNKTYKKLLFGLSLFHAVIQDRRKYGPIGWNIPYDFTNEDLAVCKTQLKQLIYENQSPPFRVIAYVSAELNYGGRVTDEKDLRLIKTLFQTFVSLETLQDHFQYSSSGKYKSIPPADHQGYLNYIKELPMEPEPDIFGLHANAQIQFGQKETRDLIQALTLIQQSNLNSVSDVIIYDIIQNLEKRLPDHIDHEEVYRRYPTLYEESMNTVLYQEVIRYNRLTDLIRVQLQEVQNALKGLVAMTEDLEAIVQAFLQNLVPKKWEAISFLSLKPLSLWAQELQDRVFLFKKWFEFTVPKAFWLSGSIFIQILILQVSSSLKRFLLQHYKTLPEGTLLPSTEFNSHLNILTKSILLRFLSHLLKDAISMVYTWKEHVGILNPTALKNKDLWNFFQICPQSTYDLMKKLKMQPMIKPLKVFGFQKYSEFQPTHVHFIKQFQEWEPYPPRGTQQTS